MTENKDGTFKKAVALFLFSFLWTTVFFYGVYVFLHPFLAIPPPEVSSLRSPEQVKGNLSFTEKLIQKATNALVSNPVLFYFYFTFIFLVFLNELTYTPLSIYHSRLDKRRKKPLTYEIPVSIIVPAHNEEKVIEGTIISLLEVNYGNKEIIVVNDGSTDRTPDVLSSYVEEGKIKLINKPKGGKAAALNTGILHSKGEILVMVDADTVLERNSIKEIVSYFQNERVIGVGGNVKVGNQINLITKLQALEYVRGLNLRRRAFDLLNTVLVLPGSINAVRKRSLKWIGLFTKDTVTEDMDMTIKLVKTGGKVIYSSEGKAYTEAPENLSDLLKQRKRWYRGVMQNILKHRKYVTKFKTFGAIGLQYMILSMLLMPVIEIGAGILTVIYLVKGIFLGEIRYLIGLTLLFLILTIIETFISILALHLDKERKALAIYTPFYVWIYRFILDIVRVESIVETYIWKTKWKATRAERYGKVTKTVLGVSKT